MAGLTIKDSVVYTWIWIVILLCIILGTGAFTFFVVSDKGNQSWDYRPVKSLPSESPYAEYQKVPFPQHIKGKGGE
jgi:hypothetical protein